MSFASRIAALAVLLVLPTAVTQAQTQGEIRADAQRVVAKAAGTVTRLRQDDDFPVHWDPKLRQAKAVMIVPEQYKAGFILGGEYGIGVLMVRGADGSFSDPAFYRLYSGSIGFQIGGQKAEMIYMIMNEKALRAIMEDKFKAGADVSVAVAHKGGGMKAGSTTNLDADIFAYAHTVGLYGGGSLEGTAITVDSDWNYAYYRAAEASPEAIMFERRFHNQGASELKALLIR